jgi:hypothetical protein
MKDGLGKLGGRLSSAAATPGGKTEQHRVASKVFRSNWNHSLLVSFLQPAVWRFDPA